MFWRIIFQKKNQRNVLFLEGNCLIFWGGKSNFFSEECFFLFSENVIRTFFLKNSLFRNIFKEYFFFPGKLKNNFLKTETVDELSLSWPVAQHSYSGCEVYCMWRCEFEASNRTLTSHLTESCWTSACAASLSPSSPWGWSSASCCCCCCCS